MTERPGYDEAVSEALDAVADLPRNTDEGFGAISKIVKAAFDAAYPIIANRVRQEAAERGADACRDAIDMARADERDKIVEALRRIPGPDEDFPFHPDGPSVADFIEREFGTDNAA